MLLVYYLCVHIYIYTYMSDTPIATTPEPTALVSTHSDGMKAFGKGVLGGITGTLGFVGETAQATTDVARTTAKGTLAVADKGIGAATATTGQAIDTTKDVAVSSLAATGTIVKAATGTAAAAIEGTANTLVNTASKIKEVAAEKGNAMAEASIAENRAKTKALQDPDNVKKQEDAARELQELKITKLTFKTEEDRLRAQADSQTRQIQLHTQELNRVAKVNGQLNKAQSRALVASAQAQKEILKAESNAERIEKEAFRDRAQEHRLVMQEDECQKVLQELADRGEVLDSTGVKIQIPADMASQMKFCKEKIYCDKTGKRVGAFGISWNNPKACANIAQRYTTFKNIHGNPATEPIATGGRKKKTRKRKTKKKRHTRNSKRKTKSRRGGTRRRRRSKYGGAQESMETPPQTEEKKLAERHAAADTILSASNDFKRNLKSTFENAFAGFTPTGGTGKKKKAASKKKKSSTKKKKLKTKKLR
jgi:hypothetical protein